MVRAFIAISCGEEAKEEMVKLQEKIRGFGSMKLIEKENMHMTLKFLGEVSEDGIDKIKGALDALSDEKEFEVELRGVGVFPKPDYVRVVWAGVGEGRDKTVALQKKVDDSLEGLSFERDIRFHPHFTLARVKSIDKKRIKDFLEEGKDMRLGSFTVGGLELMESRLSPKGPSYSVLQRVGFKKV